MPIENTNLYTHIKALAAYGKKPIIRRCMLGFGLTLLVFLASFLLQVHGKNRLQKGIAREVFRLHVRPHSNIALDQALKINVRDDLLAYAQENFKEIHSKADFSQWFLHHQETMREIAQQRVFSEGFAYGVTLDIETEKFPEKTYGDLTFPPGLYDAVIVKIGAGLGDNWWCVLYPPLCLEAGDLYMAKEQMEYLEARLTEAEIQALQNPQIEVKWKFLEWFQ